MTRPTYSSADVSFCDFNHPTMNIVRLMPTGGGGNAILCEMCYRREAREYPRPETEKWERLKVVAPNGNNGYTSKTGVLFDGAEYTVDGEGDYCWAYLCETHEQALKAMGEQDLFETDGGYVCGIYGCNSEESTHTIYLWDNRIRGNE